MPYRVVVPDILQPALAKTPVRLRNRLTKHLDYLAVFAEDNQDAKALWTELRDKASGLLRWDFQGFSVYIDVVHLKREVQLVRVHLQREDPQ